MATKKTRTTKKTTRGRTTRQGAGRRTTRRRPKWLPDDEPEPASPKAEEEAPKVEAPKVEAPTVEAPTVEAPVTWGPSDWVSVCYEGSNWFVHPQAGVFVPGTTTRLRGDLASQLPTRGFRFEVSALRRAG